MARHTKVDIYMPFFVADYLADTTDLTAEEHGAYLLLLLDLWRRDGMIEFDRHRLSRICRLTPERFDEVWKDIARFFDVSAAGVVTQGRLTHELAIAYGKKEEASRAGKASAEARRVKNGTAQPSNGRSSAVRTDVEQTFERAAEPKPNSSPSPSDPIPPPSVLSSPPDPERAIPVPAAVPPAAAPARANTPALWHAADWLRKFGVAWCDRYRALTYGQGGGDAKATAELADILASLPQSERLAAQQRAPAMFAEYLGGESPGRAKARHPWRWFVDDFNGLRVPLAVAKAPPPGRDPRCADWHAKSGRDGRLRPGGAVATCPECKHAELRAARVKREADPRTAAEILAELKAARAGP